MLPELSMMASSPHKKPIGEDGPIRVSKSDEQVKVEWKRFQHPAEKREQELGFASAFVQALNSSALNTAEGAAWTVTQLGEDDFDFQLQAGEQKRYLELQEIVIPGKRHGLPYVPGEQVIHSGKLAKGILSGVEGKALRYPRNLAQPLDLLLYITHWRFRPNDIVLKLVASGLKTQKLPLAKVYFFHQLDKAAGQVHLLYPSPDFLKGFNPESANETMYMNFDPAGFLPVNDGTTVGVKFNISSDAVKKLGLGK